MYVTVLPAKSDSDVVFCLQLLSKTLICICPYVSMSLTSGHKRPLHGNKLAPRTPANGDIWHLLAQTGMS